MAEKDDFAARWAKRSFIYTASCYNARIPIRVNEYTCNRIRYTAVDGHGELLLGTCTAAGYRKSIVHLGCEHM